MAFFHAVSENETYTCEPSFNRTDPEVEFTAQPKERPLPAETESGLEIEGHESSEANIGSSLCKIKLPDFPVDRPWLPQKALKIIEKIKRGSISENDLISLMNLVSDEATAYFQLQMDKFVASTFFGRIVEVSDTRVDLLNNIQTRTFDEEIFVWRVGARSFSGRL